MSDEITGLTKRITEELRDDAGLEMVIVHGSQVSGKARADSDVDIAVLYDAPLSVRQRFSLLARLENVLGKPVDLVDLFSLHGTILKKILTTGKVLLGRGSVKHVQLLRRMIFNQEDMMPYYNRAIAERLKRFIHG
jgi:predicted nucleotidyltransferase